MHHVVGRLRKFVFRFCVRITGLRYRLSQEALRLIVAVLLFYLFLALFQNQKVFTNQYSDNIINLHNILKITKSIVKNGRYSKCKTA